MKSLFARFLAALFCFVFAGLALAGDFKSAIIATGDTLPTPIHVSGDQFLVIRNFTQDGGTTRGLVNVYQIATGQSANVLAATIIDPNNPPALEVINNVVIAGPANVTVMCGDGTNCFITYKKGSE